MTSRDKNKPPLDEFAKLLLKHSSYKVHENGKMAVYNVYAALVDLWKAAGPLRDKRTALWAEMDKVRTFLRYFRNVLLYTLPSEVIPQLEGFNHESK